MRKEQFEYWLKSKGIKTYANYVSQIKRLERAYGDFDEHYEKDGCATILAEFEYTANDMLNKREPKHKIPITVKSGGDKYKSYHKGTADLSSRINKYVEFRKNWQNEHIEGNVHFNSSIKPGNLFSQPEKDPQPVFDDLTRRKRNVRYKSYPVGNAQNSVIRTILSNIGDESFSVEGWEEAKRYFERKCAYCGAIGKKIVIDHAMPINRDKLGEHRLGNLIPACADCNAKKGGKQDYIEFCGENEEAITRIREYMKSRNYVPLTVDHDKNKNIQLMLNKAHEEIRIITERYIGLINAIFFSD